MQSPDSIGSAEPPRPYYSISQMRAFFGGCSYVYHLKYNLGFKERISSAAFLGQLVSRLIQRAYHGIPWQEAHEQVWRKWCPSLIGDLRAWYVLDQEYQRSGHPRTKARQRWSEQHPEYDELALHIESARGDVLADYTWAKSASLSAYYRWSVELITPPTREQILLPGAVLVEGQPLVGSDGKRVARFHSRSEKAADDNKDDQYTLLRGVLDNGLPVGGIPDVFAVDASGDAWVADYKVMSTVMTKEQLAQDEQLALYVALLQQAGYLAPDQRVNIGHAYLTERQGVQWVWTDLSPLALPRFAAQLAFMDRQIRLRAYMPVRGIATGAKSPCLACSLASACQETFDLAGCERSLLGEGKDTSERPLFHHKGPAGLKTVQPTL